ASASPSRPAAVQSSSGGPAHQHSAQLTSVRPSPSASDPVDQRSAQPGQSGPNHPSTFQTR
ncbi:hypothetical protein CRG98_039678, partial [Punica granatum]